MERVVISYSLSEVELHTYILNYITYSSYIYTKAIAQQSNRI